MSYDIVVFVVFLILIYILERKKFKREGLAFLRRTKKGLKVLKNFAEKNEKIINYIIDFGVVSSIGILSKKFVRKKFYFHMFLYALVSYVLYWKLHLITDGFSNMFKSIKPPDIFNVGYDVFYFSIQLFARDKNIFYLGMFQNITVIGLADGGINGNVNGSDLQYGMINHVPFGPVGRNRSDFITFFYT